MSGRTILHSGEHKIAENETKVKQELRPIYEVYAACYLDLFLISQISHNFSRVIDSFNFVVKNTLSNLIRGRQKSHLNHPRHLYSYPPNRRIVRPH